MKPAPKLLPSTIVEGGTPAKTATPKRWYGGQILLVDLATLGLVYASWEKENLPALLLSSGMWVYAPTFVHVLQGNSSGAWSSVTTNLALPFLGLLIGSRYGRACDTTYDGGPNSDGHWYTVQTDCRSKATTGFLMGTTAASLLDVLVYSWRKLPAQDRAPLAQSAGLHVDMAGVIPHPGGATLALGGHF